MSKSFRNAFLLTLTVLIIGFSISALTYSLDISFSFITEPTPTSFFEIFFHNSIFIAIYAIPVFGFVYFVYSFTVIFIAIGLLFLNKGILYTLIHLIHLPFELFAFALVISMGINYERKNFFIAIAVLFISAFIEFYI